MRELALDVDEPGENPPPEIRGRAAYTVRRVTVQVGIRKTTDRGINNVVWKCYDFFRNLVEAKMPDEDNPTLLVPVSEPVLLSVALGRKSADATTVKHRYLEEVPYGPLVNG